MSAAAAPAPGDEALRRALEWLCGTLAAAALFAIMILTLVDVSGRKAISQSVPGSLEMTELLLVVTIFAGLPLVSLAGEHVVFDSLDPWLPERVRRIQGLCVDLACALALIGLAWVMWGMAGARAGDGETTAQLKLPIAPFVYGMSVLCAVTGLVHLLLVLRPVAHHHVGVEGESPS
ncbi:MAG TPA: TRAP transporter small permease [Burkholderiaceae bacterium]|nr:TRAP transporter small permease [Burkholderiaceae bacterium]